MDNFKKLHQAVSQKKTLLGVGPMSKNIVDASIELSDKHNIPIMLIASRRQIESHIYGGGYVNNWTTSDFSKYVGQKQKKNNIFLARDHGGPWQSQIDVENKLSLKNAMKMAKKSFEDDILNNFSLIHIDTSVSLNNSVSFNQALNRLFELYEHCFIFAKKNKKKILFEVGTEEQNGSTSSLEGLELTLNKLKNFCTKNKFPMPSFVVVQSGTKVMELRNIGSFEWPTRIKNELPIEIHLLKTLEICKKYQIYMKEHNADYLSTESLNWHPKIGIHAANIAPEFGVAETKALVDILTENNLKEEREKFLVISHKSNKWKKWMMKKTMASDYEKSIISGHYVFSNKEFLDLKKNIISKLSKKGINLDNFLKKIVSNSIKRYLKSFRLI